MFGLDQMHRAFADNRLIVAKTMIYVFDRVGKTVGKGFFLKVVNPFPHNGTF